MAKSAALGKKRKSETSVSDSEVIEAANLLIQLSGSSDTVYYDAQEEEEDSVGKTTPTSYVHRDDHDQVSSSSSLKYMVFEDEDEVGFGNMRIGKRRYRLVSDLYEKTKPVKNGGVVNRKKRRMMVK